MTESPPASEPASRGAASNDAWLERVLRHNLRIGAGRDVRLAGWALLALACGFLAYVARMHEITHDAFHEMALFREALVLGKFPTQDVFAYTPTVNPAVHHEWGTGAVLYFATLGSGLGLVGLSLLKLLLMAALWLILYRVARLRGAHPIVFAALACVTFPVLWVGFSTVRAQLFTLVFVALQLWMQELDWRGRRAWILLWLAMLVAWLNIHAGFVVGLGLIAFHSLERFGASLLRNRSWLAALGDTWHLMLAAPAAICALPINPYGWAYIPYLVRAIGMDRPLIREWKPIWFTYAPGLTICMLAVSIAFFVYAQRCNRLRRLRGAAFLALCIYMTIKHIRHGSIFAVIWIAYVPAWISRTSLGKSLVDLAHRHRRGLIGVCQALCCGSLLFATVHQFWRPTLPPRPRYSTASFPVAAVDYLKTAGFAGNLFTPFHVGAYVSWELYPRALVSFDGRYEVAYQAHVMPEHNQFLAAEGMWWTIPDSYGTDAILVHREAPLYAKLRELWSGPVAARPDNLRDWCLAYVDDGFMILASPHARLIPCDRTGLPLTDGAWEAFTSEHAHWNRRPQSNAMANRTNSSH